jgi:hypothetical protein
MALDPFAQGGAALGGCLQQRLQFPDLAFLVCQGGDLKLPFKLDVLVSSSCILAPKARALFTILIQ